MASKSYENLLEFRSAIEKNNLSKVKSMLTDEKLKKTLNHSLEYNWEFAALKNEGLVIYHKILKPLLTSW